MLDPLVVDACGIKVGCLGAQTCTLAKPYRQPVSAEAADLERFLGSVPLDGRRVCFGKRKREVSAA